MLTVRANLMVSKNFKSYKLNYISRSLILTVLSKLGCLGKWKGNWQDRHFRLIMLIGKENLAKWANLHFQLEFRKTLIGVCVDTYVFYQSVLEKKTYELQIWSVCIAKRRNVITLWCRDIMTSDTNGLYDYPFNWNNFFNYWSSW